MDPGCRHHAVIGQPCQPVASNIICSLTDQAGPHPALTAARFSHHSTGMDLPGIIEQMEAGEQDRALVVLQSFNKEMSQCFTFSREDNQEREHLGELLLNFLNRELQPSCLLACLETVRILTRDKHCLDPFIGRSAMLTLARYAGIAIDQPAHTNQGLLEESKAADLEDGDPGALLQEPPPPSENPDQEVIVEALKSICNILLHSESGQVVAADLHLITGVAERLKQWKRPTWNHEVGKLNKNLLPLINMNSFDTSTASCLSCFPGNQLEATLCLCWPDPLVTARKGYEGVPPEELPPLSRQQTELAMEILKILFNITFDANRRKVDEEEAAEYRHLGALLRHCLMSRADGEERSEEFHSHTVNLLGNLPLLCLDVLLLPKVEQGSIEYMGVNMDAVNMLLEFMEKRLERGQKLKETLLPSLNLLTESSRIHRETRKFLRSKVLPPLRDVKNRPEVGNALRNKLVRLMTHIDTDVKNCAAEFLFVLCKESVSRFIKYTGYGNAAGLLAARGLLRGSRDSGIYSEDEDSETEEYREAKPHINLITGVVEEEQPNPMEGMSEEQKEYEAMKLVKMFDRLSRF
ncbi:PREDICTED: synembryn-A-like [Cyprinodon variegatus]|uniref:synembryn-A-like n=1 Tax=Cyprinodon variegatus TaxID=28743 RepID=UPI000742C44C|nr:PREDICTED: synembryn-A-like [Cyprinodon variegatus]